MSLKDFNTEYHQDKEKLYVVICVYHPMEYGRQQSVNHMLETVQKELKGELSDYEKIQVAYVYETPYLDVKDFEILTKDTKIYYKEPCVGDEERHNLAHMLYMGLLRLQDVQKEQKSGKYRLYLLAEDDFRVYHENQIVYRDGKDIKIHPFFENLEYKPILLRTENVSGDMLVKYFDIHGELRPVFQPTGSLENLEG